MNPIETLTSLTERIITFHPHSDADSAESESATDQESDWNVAETPTEKALHGVVQTAQGPCAVGAEGNVLGRTDDAWAFLIESGPAVQQNVLTAIDVTSDGKRIWMAGSSGTLGMYDMDIGKKHDYSAPEERTSTWEAIATTGEAGNERLRVANGSGEVFTVTIDDDGYPDYGEAVEPGSGSTIPALGFGGDTCYAINTSGNVFQETDDDWESIGIENAQVTFYDLHASKETLLVAGGDGLLYRYDRACENWTPIEAGEGSLHSINHRDEETVAVGASGHIYHQVPQHGWERVASPIEGDLHSIALGETDVAVGAGGTILER